MDYAHLGERLEDETIDQFAVIRDPLVPFRCQIAGLGGVDPGAHPDSTEGIEVEGIRRPQSDGQTGCSECADNSSAICEEV